MNTTTMPPFWGIALLVLTACGDPLPPEAQWLAGRWRWLGSCCDIAGTGPVPSSPEAFVIDFHPPLTSYPRAPSA
jgi:hypothetical protein